MTFIVLLFQYSKRHIIIKRSHINNNYYCYHSNQVFPLVIHAQLFFAFPKTAKRHLFFSVYCRGALGRYKMVNLWSVKNDLKTNYLTILLQASIHFYING